MVADRIASRWVALRAAFIGSAIITAAPLARTQPEAEVHEPTGQDQASPSEQPEFAEHAQAGIAHYRAGRWEQALSEFVVALQHPADDIDRASVEFNAGACLFALGRYAEAEERFSHSAELDPNNATLACLNAGLAAVRAGHLDVAETQLAVNAKTDEERARHAELRAELEQAKAALPPPPPAPEEASAPPSAIPTSSIADRLPTPGLHGWLAIGGGYDSNAAQSGVGDTVGSSMLADRGSGFGSALGSLHATHHFSPRRAGRLYYLGDWLGLLAPPVRDFSLQSHNVGARWFVAFSTELLLRLGGGGGLTLSGLEQVEPMMAEGFGDLRLDWDQRGASRTRFDTRITGSSGLGDWSYLTGVTADVRLMQRFEWEHVELGLAIGGRYTGLGTIRLELDADDLPGCSAQSGVGAGPGAATDCSGETYVIPLAWSAPRVELDVMAYPVERLGLGASTGFEYRAYHESSFVTRVPSSRKRRADTRWRAGASAELTLDEANHFTVLLDYRFLGSRSNIAYDASDPDHYLDYDDRNFAQHIVELGLLVVF